MKKLIHFSSLLFLLVVTNSCLEEFDAATEEFEDVLVVDATITNELKYHQITLTRTYSFEEYEPNVETGATVSVVTNNSTYNFTETTPGLYTSNTMFKAEANVDYNLHIITNDGKEYKSQNTQLTHESSIDNVYAVQEINEDGIEGVSLYVDSFDATNSSKYYGYEIEETYKIIAPYWTPDDLILDSSGNFSVVPRSQEEQICYNTIPSIGRMLTDTNLLQEDRVSGHLLTFIPNDDIRLNTRYSILVKQYIQSSESYNYLKVLEEFSSSESLLSQSQPGFLASNIYAVNNTNEKVLGFFEVSSISEKRIFFDRSEVLNDPYPWTCSIIDPPANELRTLLRLDRVTLIYEKPQGEDGGPYDVVNSICGDCTKSGSNIRPDFWID